MAVLIREAVGRNVFEHLNEEKIQAGRSKSATALSGKTKRMDYRKPIPTPHLFHEKACLTHPTPAMTWQ